MGIGSGGSSLLLFGAYAFVAQYVSKTIIGNYQIVSTLIGIALLTTYPKMSGALIVAAAQKAHGAFTDGIELILKKSWQGIIMLGIFSAYYWVRGLYGLAAAIATGALFFIPYAVSGLYESYYVGIGKIRRYAIGSLISTAAIASALVGAAVLYPTSASALVLAFFGTNALTVGAWTYYIARQSKANNSPSHEKSLAFAKKTSWTEILLQVTNYIDIILINAFLGPKDVAIYAIARMAPETIKGFVKNAGVLSVAHIATMEKMTVKKMIIKRAIQSAVIAIGITGLYIALAPSFFALAFPTYSESVFYSQLLAFSFLAFPAHLAESALGALFKKRETVVLNTAAASAMLIFSCALIPPFGILGAVLARIAARFSNAAVALYLTLRYI